MRVMDSSYTQHQVIGTAVTIFMVMVVLAWRPTFYDNRISSRTSICNSLGIMCYSALFVMYMDHAQQRELPTSHLDPPHSPSSLAHDFLLT